VRVQPFGPQFVRKQSTVNSDATPNAQGQRASAFRRDPFVAMAPFCSPAFMGRLEQYMNELQGELEGIGKDAARECNDWSGTSSGASEGRLSLDISEDEVAYWLKVDVPGMTREDIQLKVTDDRLLVISAERKPETADDASESKDGFVRKERRFGKFGRSLRLPKNIDVAGITAEAKDGVMTVSLPKNPEEAPREQQIAIN
jgi:HSP20 family protein